MDLLRLKAAEIVIKEGMSGGGEEFNSKDKVNQTGLIDADTIMSALREVEQLMGFDIKQAELRANHPNFFSRVTTHIQRFFQRDAVKEQREPTEKESQNTGCFSRILAFFSRLQE